MKSKSFLIAAFLLPVIILGGCISVFVPVPMPTFAPTPILLPTNPPPPVEPPPTSIQAAPMCAADPLIEACVPPQVIERDKFCVEKVAYVLIALPVGDFFQPASDGLICTDEGIRDGMQSVSCTGQRLTSYYLKVCNPACAAAIPLATGTGQCPDGYGYNAAGNCCWPMPAPDAGCTHFQVNVGSCK